MTSWWEHVRQTTAKATKSLGFLRRNLHSCPQHVRAQVYLTLIRPVLEYASTVWDPHQIQLIQQIEQVQRQAARFATRDYYLRDPGCVTYMLNIHEIPCYLKAYFSPQQINHINVDPVTLKCFDKIITGVWQTYLVVNWGVFKASAHSFKQFTSRLLKSTFSLSMHIYNSDGRHAWFHLHGASRPARSASEATKFKMKNFLSTVGLEPTTIRFKVWCSTDWASRAWWMLSI